MRNRERMRTIVAVLVIASMVLLAAGALAGVLMSDGEEAAGSAALASRG